MSTWVFHARKKLFRRCLRIAVACHEQRLLALDGLDQWGARRQSHLLAISNGIPSLTFTTAPAAERHSAFSDRRASPQTISTSYGGDKWTFFARSVCYYPHCSGSQCHGYINTAKTRPSLSDEQLPSESDSYVWTFPQSSAAYYHPR